MNKKLAEIVSNVVILVVIVCIAMLGMQSSVSFTFVSQDYHPIYRGSSIGNNVSLMINVYWGSEYIEEILSILNKYDAKVTFFVGGYWASSNIHLVQKILDNGHELGNHGYFHKEHSKLDYNANCEEIHNNHILIDNTVGYKMQLFAPPSGDFSKDTLLSAYNNGYKTIMWSRDTIDWRDKNAELVYNRATKDTSAGELILMHPTLHTTTALPKILQYYQQTNYKVVTVSDNINGENYDHIKDIC